MAPRKTVDEKKDVKVEPNAPNQDPVEAVANDEHKERVADVTAQEPSEKVEPRTEEAPAPKEEVPAEEEEEISDLQNDAYDLKDEALERRDSGLPFDASRLFAQRAVFDTTDSAGAAANDIRRSYAAFDLDALEHDDVPDHLAKYVVSDAGAPAILKRNEDSRADAPSGKPSKQ